MIWITLPTGTYLPRFFRAGVSKANRLQISPEALPLQILRDDSTESLPRSGPPLSLFQLAVPTLVAIRK
jgi:hypothetical protein